VQRGSLEARFSELLAWFAPFKRALVAFSGGVDSTLVAYAAKTALGQNAVAVTQASALMAEAELEEAKRLARQLSLNHVVIGKMNEMSPLVKANTPLRCYHCREGLASALRQLAKELDADVIVDGTELDDLKDFRPGLRALREHGVRSPLVELGFTKQEVRALARALGLPNHDKPAESCLATRIPHWTALDTAVLRRVERAEALVREMTGARMVRVRCHGEVARIEVEPHERHLFFDESLLDRLSAALKELGFVYVTLDLEGYRRGSVNATPSARRPSLRLASPSSS
jgi:uncharacterized protein